MKNFKKQIKEALTPHYLRESVNEDKKTFDWNDLLDALGKIPGSGKIQKKIKQTDPEVK